VIARGLPLRLCAAIALAATSCGDPPARTVVVHADPRAAIDLAKATWAPASAVRGAALIGATRLELTLDADAPALVVRAPGACPLEVPAGSAGAEALQMTPWIDLGPDRPQLGYGAPFRVRAQPGCREAQAQPVAWRRVDGALVEFRVDADGLGISGTMPAFAEAHGAQAGTAWGLLPVSPRTSGAVTFEATAEGPGWTARRTVRVGAAARATGLPTLSVGQRALFAGRGWTILQAPLTSIAGIEHEAPELHALEPDVPGRWLLADAEGRELSVSAGRHDTMPLDCGRAECHVAATAGAVHSPMTHVLRRGLEGELGADYDPRCAIACHATGEPGIGDGFDAVLASVEVALPERPRAGAWAALPAPARRLGVVGCTACHGPSALPEPSARWRVLRDDVCATCHDAPPRYGHVAAWRSSRMARADRTEGTEAAGCADCHTTAGFLAARGIRPMVEAPGAQERSGIGCAACHAAHGESMPRALLRRLPLPGSIAPRSIEEDSPARVCLACHAPREGLDAPAASAGALWLGQGGHRADGSALRGASPHTEVTGGCIGCHAAAPSGVAVERGADHGFQADHARCGRCHGGSPPRERPTPGGLVADRARAAWSALVARGWAKGSFQPGGNPPHARKPEMKMTATSEAHAALVRNLLLVLEDPAAWVHNAPYARALLDEVERALKSPADEKP
jgi:hypothetical protein